MALVPTLQGPLSLENIEQSLNGIPNLMQDYLSTNKIADAVGAATMGGSASGKLLGLNQTTVAPVDGGSSFNWQNAAGGASIGMAIGQAVGAMYSAWESGKTQKYVLNKQAEIQKINREMAQLSAETAFRQGEAQVAQLTYKAGQIKAKQRTAFAANGIKGTSGSASEVMASTDIMKEVDKLTAQMNALQAAWGYKMQGYQASAQGGIYSGLSSYMKQASIGKGFSSLLESGTTAADRWYRYFGGGSNVMGYGDY